MSTFRYLASNRWMFAGMIVLADCVLGAVTQAITGHWFLVFVMIHLRSDLIRMLVPLDLSQGKLLRFRPQRIKMRTVR